jgi:hypothetical protein
VNIAASRTNPTPSTMAEASGRASRAHGSSGMTPAQAQLQPKPRFLHGRRPSASQLRRLEISAGVLYFSRECNAELAGTSNCRVAHDFGVWMYDRFAPRPNLCPPNKRAELRLSNTGGASKLLQGRHHRCRDGQEEGS